MSGGDEHGIDGSAGMKPIYYKLIGRLPVPCAVREDGVNPELHRVDQDTIDRLHISTVFLGQDHGSGDGPPMLFETMIFDADSASEDDLWQCQYRSRCSTWNEAEQMHAMAVSTAKGWATRATGSASYRRQPPCP